MRQRERAPQADEISKEFSQILYGQFPPPYGKLSSVILWKELIHLNIRPYRPGDRERLRMICKETAFPEYRQDPQKLESVPIMYNDYFTEYEPEHIFVVADEQDEAVGYIICAANYPQFVTVNRTEITRRLLETAPGEVPYLNQFLDDLEKIKDRPVHLHLDLLPQCRHRGLGTRLILTLMDALRAEGYDHLSGCDVHRNAASYALCKKLGFREIYDYGNGCVSISIDL